MNFLTRFALPAVAALVVSALPLGAQEAVTLKQQFLVGKKYFQTMEMEQDTVIAIGPQKMNQRMTMTMEMSTKVTRHEDGVRKRLAVRYDRMAMKMKMNEQEMGFDSAKPEEDAAGMGKSMGAIIGKEFRVLANEKDEITEVENLDEVLGAAGAGAAMGQMFNKESLTDMLRQSTLKGLPDHPVKPGDTWPFDYAMKVPPLGALTVKGTYTLKSVAPRAGIPTAEIAMDATLEFGPAAEGGAEDKTGAGAMLSAMGMKLSGGKLAGTIWFDPALGTAREVQFDQEMEISMNNPAKPEEKLSLPMKQKIKQTLTKVEDAP